MLLSRYGIVSLLHYLQKPTYTNKTWSWTSPFVGIEMLMKYHIPDLATEHLAFYIFPLTKGVHAPTKSFRGVWCNELLKDEQSTEITEHLSKITME